MIAYVIKENDGMPLNFDNMLRDGLFLSKDGAECAIYLKKSQDYKVVKVRVEEAKE